MKINDEIKLRNQSMRTKLRLSRLLPNLPCFFLVAFGSIILVWVGWLTWYDMTSWGKDIALIFFGSRTGEAISLGIGMKVIHYFLIGLALLLSGLLTFHRKRSEAVKLHFSHLLRTQLQKGKEPLEGVETSKITKAKHVSPCSKSPLQARPPECGHFFGYLKKIPRNTQIPDECFGCPKMVDCLYYDVLE